MRTSRRGRSIAAMLFCLLLLVVAGCGGDDESGETTAPAGGGAAEETAEPIRVGLVTDVGGLNDRGFNQLANEGLEAAKSELGVEGRVLTSDANSDYVPNLSSLAQQRYDLVIGIGFLMAEAVETVANRFPETSFAIIDSSQAAMKSTPANVRGLLFKEQDAGYLAGYLAGLYAKDNDVDTISSVGGEKIPPVDHYIAGYEAGAKEANPDITTLHAYSQDFVDQAKCKEIALNQIERGSGIVFQVAGQCGLGALDAAQENDGLGVGVDADQGYLGDHILTSAMKRVDVAVTDTIRAVQEDAFKGGSDMIFDLENEGVGLGEINAQGAKYQDQIDKVRQQLASGEITAPDTVP
jgi:basic membrane protein A and related proteins